MAEVKTELLAIYLQDHLAGATAAVELCRRAAGAHQGSSLGDVLEVLTLEATSDRQALVDLMALMEVPPDRIKMAAAWLGEKVGRLKLNGAIMRRSPLSDVVELEAMRMALEWKAAGWRVLRALSDSEPRLAAADLEGLLARAADQITRVEDLRLTVARERLTDSRGP